MDCFFPRKPNTLIPLSNPGSRQRRIMMLLPPPLPSSIQNSQSVLINLISRKSRIENERTCKSAPDRCCGTAGASRGCASQGRAAGKKEHLSIGISHIISEKYFFLFRISHLYDAVVHVVLCLRAKPGGAVGAEALEFFQKLIFLPCNIMWER